MKRLLLVLAFAAAFAPAALAKGPSQAAISGPGLAGTLSFEGNGEHEGTALYDLTQDAGFFPAVFGQSPDPMLHGRPSGTLGPRYTIHYVVPDGEGTKWRVVQDLYPYAQGGPVTHMTAGQGIFGEQTRGGWYRSDPGLEALLVRHGLPRVAPSSGAGSSAASTATALAIGAPVAILIAGAAAFVMRRRLTLAR
ncbi:MAG TPA: hypothetical protein VLU96_07115 [Gaiellaceae bacterium]|nr:hypothetical protein [Gaiellaceae bacterium]